MDNLLKSQTSTASPAEPGGLLLVARPKRLGDLTHELYIHMRVLSASNSQEDVDGTMSALEKHSPAVWNTLTPGAWGEPGVD